jgi:hypothetical protein
MDHFGEFLTLAGLLLPAAVAIKKAAGKRAVSQRAMLSQFAPSTTQLRAQADTPVMPPVIARKPVQAEQRKPATVVPSALEAAPQEETRLIEGLFSQPRSLVAAFVASEILGPPVAFRRH